MKASILNPHHFFTTQWSGGRSTQLFIFPEDSSYADRNFEFRISTAKVEVGESTFTTLPGIDRKLMILEGEIHINHEGYYGKHLKPFDVDSFSGDWKTTAVGKCMDFNVMTSGQKRIELYYLEMETISNYKLKAKSESSRLFLYANVGTVKVQVLKENYILETGSLLSIEDFSNSWIFISSDEEFGLVVVELN